MRRLTTYLGLTLMDGMAKVLERGSSHLWSNEKWIRLYHFILKKAGLANASHYMNAVAMDLMIKGPDEFEDPEMKHSIKNCRTKMNNAVGMHIPERPEELGDDVLAGNVRSKPTIVITDLRTKAGKGSIYLAAGMTSAFHYPNLQIFQLGNYDRRTADPVKRYTLMFDDAINAIKTAADDPGLAVHIWLSFGGLVIDQGGARVDAACIGTGIKASSVEKVIRCKIMEVDYISSLPVFVMLNPHPRLNGLSTTRTPRAWPRRCMTSCPGQVSSARSTQDLGGPYGCVGETALRHRGTDRRGRLCLRRSRSSSSGRRLPCSVQWSQVR